MPAFGFSLLIAFLVVAVVSLQRKYYIIQYLFFIRYPILLGGLVLLLPLISFAVAPESLRNLYVLEFGGLVIVVWLALSASESPLSASRPGIPRRRLVTVPASQRRIACPTVSGPPWQARVTRPAYAMPGVLPQNSRGITW